MTYQELLKTYSADDPIEQFSKNLQLARDLNNTAKTSPSVNMLMMAWGAKHGTAASIHPDDFIQHCQDFGFAEWPDLEKFILAADKTGFNPQYFVDCIDPPFPDTDETEKIHAIHLHSEIRKIVPISIFDLKITSDSEYELYNYEDVVKMVQANPSSKYQYVKLSRDCDDFTRIFLGWLSMKNKGNMACGEMSADLIKTNGVRVGHSLCWAMTKERKLLVIEPQNDRKIWEYGTPLDWSGVEEILPVNMRG